MKVFKNSLQLPLYIFLIISFSFVTSVKSQGNPNQLSDEQLKAVFEEAERLFPSDQPGEEDVYRAEKLLISATGSQKPVRLAPSVASVITKEEIKEIGATTLNEILETVPGLHVVPSSKWFTSIWSIRGIHTSVNPHVLMLINGVPLHNNYTGSRGLSFYMPVSMISRVEVVRGPGSAVYGADAFSGVVNVITKDNFEIDGTEAGARYGSFSTYDTWLQHGGQYSGWDVWGGFEIQKTDGDSGRIVEKDYMHAIGLSALSHAPGPLDTRYEVMDGYIGIRKKDITLRLYGNLKESGNGGPGATQALTYDSDMEAERFLADLTYHNDRLVDDLDLTAQFSYTYVHADAMVQFYPTAYLNMLGNPIYVSQDVGGEVIGLYTGIRNHQIRLGVGMKNFDIEPDQYKNFGPAAGPLANWFGPLVHVTSPDHIFISDANRTLWYALFQDEWYFAKKWELTYGVRYDEYSDFGSTVNPRAALVWESRYDLTTKLLYGQAFRAPSFSEQYIKNNPQAIGNENLSPEEIETVELVFDYQPNAYLRTALNIFHYEAENLIEYQGYSPGISPDVAENYARQEGNGFEIELDWQALEELRIRSNVAFVRARNKNDDSLIYDVPEVQFYLNPHWDFTKYWSLDGQLYYIADRHRQQGDPRGEIDDYELVNVTLRRTNIAKHWEMAVSIRNLFDADAREPSPYDTSAPEGAYIPNDYPLNTRAIWTELRASF